MKTLTHNALSALTIALIFGMSGTSMAGGSETRHSVYDIAMQHNADYKARRHAPASARTPLNADDDGWSDNTRHNMYHHLAAQQHRQAGQPVRSSNVQQAVPDDGLPSNTRHSVYELTDQLNRQRDSAKVRSSLASKPVLGP